MSILPVVSSTVLKKTESRCCSWTLQEPLSNMNTEGAPYGSPSVMVNSIVRNPVIYLHLTVGAPYRIRYRIDNAIACIPFPLSIIPFHSNPRASFFTYLPDKGRFLATHPLSSVTFPPLAGLFRRHDRLQTAQKASDCGQSCSPRR